MIAAWRSLASMWPDVRPVSQLNGCNNRTVRKNRDEGVIPFLIANERGDSELRSNTKICADRCVRPSASASNEILAHFLMSKAPLQTTTSCEVVSCPGLCTLALPSDPAAQQVAVIGVAASPGSVGVVVPVVVYAANGI